MDGKSKIALIVNYYGMQMGGVETAFSELMIYAVKRGYHVVWITTENCIKNSAHKEISENADIEKVLVNPLFRCRYTAPFLCEDERAVVVSCEPLTYVLAESLRGRLKEKAFESYLILPNFRGKIYYPEQFFSGIFKNHVAKFMRRLAVCLNESYSIRAFAEQHLDAYEKAYDIVIPDKPSKILGGLRRIEELNEKDIINKAKQRQEKFEIIACSRFDFPHKAFLLGAVDAYAELKDKYQQLKLTIIGYGAGEQELKNKINSLPLEASADIEMTGALPLDIYKERCKNGHLLIGLAGALLEGATSGIPSLVARHFSDTCETYGFISDVPDRLRDDEGENVCPYIEDTINMSDEDYINRIRNDYRCVEQLSDYHPEYIFEQKNLRGCSLSRLECFRLKNLKILISLKSRFSDFDEFA